MELNPQAVVIANEMLWARHPELRGRHLSMNSEDAAYRREWRQNYKDAANQAPKPPRPKLLPQPVDIKAPKDVAGRTIQPCGAISNMTHEQKMAAAISAANLWPQVMEELGDIETLVTSMVVVGGGLVAIAATGYGAVAEAIAAGLLLLGAAMSGAQIGAGINSMIDFFQKTRCDRAKNSDDLVEAGLSFGDGIAKMGVGGLNLLLVLAGGRKVSGKGETPSVGRGPPKPSPKFRPPTNLPQLPPTKIPKGWRVRSMSPTEQYPNGYWKLEKPLPGGHWQPIDPSTMKPGSRWETHVEFPPPVRGN